MPSSRIRLGSENFLEFTRKGLNLDEFSSHTLSRCFSLDNMAYTSLFHSRQCRAESPPSLNHVWTIGSGLPLWMTERCKHGLFELWLVRYYRYSVLQELRRLRCGDVEDDAYEGEYKKKWEWVLYILITSTINGLFDQASRSPLQGEEKWPWG